MRTTWTCAVGLALSVGCASPSASPSGHAPAASSPGTLPPTSAEPERPEGHWVPWRPCGCLEGCAFIEEDRARLHEGQGVTVVRANVRESARPLAPGTVAVVERAATTDGVGMFVLGSAGPPGPDGTPGPVICSYLCETTFAGPLPPQTCAGGTL